MTKHKEAPATIVCPRCKHAAIVEAVEEARERIMVRGERPEIDGSDDCRRVLTRPATGAPRRMSPAEAELARRYAAAKRAADAAQAELEILANQVRAAVGSARPHRRRAARQRAPACRSTRPAGSESPTCENAAQEAPDAIASNQDQAETATVHDRVRAARCRQDHDGGVAS